LDTSLCTLIPYILYISRLSFSRCVDWYMSRRVIFFETSIVKSRDFPPETSTFFSFSDKPGQIIYHSTQRFTRYRMCFFLNYFIFFWFIGTALYMALRPGGVNFSRDKWNWVDKNTDPSLFDPPISRRLKVYNKTVESTLSPGLTRPVGNSLAKYFKV
jgi:hypothetical protein